MTVLDFKEIPEAHIATGEQDTFELFARDFLDFIGYKIITNPDRGADGGVDLIVEESRTGVGGETIIRWLVSCKHKAHSGKSVTPTDDANIRDRVEARIQLRSAPLAKLSSLA
ncbi:restriction endonuclease [Shewanella fodinae]|uniref:Restriction endonuclease n=1 Tax=Shewanella fodinae TaxID=552357 RepID=A0A4R2EZL4_9GAMM|nr:restriction endonuclease [Shewanella fodinae]TCN75720.1 restriction endonuclease [Shewanella fodinae]